MDWTGPLVEAIRDDPTTAAYTRTGYPSISVVGIFDEEFISVGGLGEVGIGGNTPVFICETSDVPAVARGDKFRINGTDYYVVEPRPDGKGVTALTLSKDP